jgi:1-acyl-sn-glycerol-3-phosphate acyltransferase
MWRIRIYTLLTVPAFGILYLITAVLVLSLIPFLFLRMRKTVLFLMKYSARLGFFIIGKKLHIEGVENIKKGDNYILIANHSSLFDIVAIVSFFPDLSWFGHERLTRVPVFRQVLKLTDYVPLRKTNIRNTKEMISQLIEKSKGHTIAIFPEGTRSLDGKVNDFYRGFIILLRNAEVDVLPVTLNGFFGFKPKNRFYIGFNSKLNVIVHRPIRREELINKKDSEIIETIRERISSSVIV